MRSGADAISRLRDGQGDLVVAVDFGGVREEAGFPDLLPYLEIDHEIVVPVTTVQLEGDSLDLARHQLELWLDGIRRSGRPVTAIMGYCAGSAIAARLVRELAWDAPAPALVLLDPSWPDGEVLREAHEVAVRSLLSALPDSVGIEPFAQEPDGRAEDLATLARHLVDHYARAAGVVAERLKLRDDAVRGLVRRVDRHLTYLVVASVETARVSAVDLAVDPASVLTILSAATPDDVARLGGATLRTELPRPRLLADPDVAGHVSGFVRGRAPVV